jgi:hypothetical protein
MILTKTLEYVERTLILSLVKVHCEEGTTHFAQSLALPYRVC